MRKALALFCSLGISSTFFCAQGESCPVQVSGLIRTFETQAFTLPLEAAIFSSKAFRRLPRPVRWLLQPYKAPEGISMFPMAGVTGAPIAPMAKSERVALKNLLSFLPERDTLPTVCDVILVLGTNNEEVPRAAARLDKRLGHPLYVVTGGRGRATPADWNTEADRFAEILMEEGIPEKRIRRESSSTNTGQNLQFSLALLRKLEELGELRSGPWNVAVVQWGVYQRRAAASARKVFGESAHIYAYAPYRPSLFPAPSDMTRLAYARYLAHEALGEIWRLTQYAKPQHDFMIPVSLTTQQLRDALKLLAHLLGDPSVPPDNKAILEQRWRPDLQKELALSS